MKRREDLFEADVESQLWKLFDSKATTLEVIEDSLTILRVRVTGGFVEESRIKEKCLVEKSTCFYEKN